MCLDRALHHGVGGEDEEEKEEGGKDKHDGEKKVSASHRLIEFTLYRDTLEKGHSPDEPPTTAYATVTKIVVPASLYDAVSAEEERQHDGIHYYNGMEEVTRVVIEIR